MVAWPVVIQPLPKCPGYEEAKVILGEKDPMLVPIMDFTGIEARLFEFRAISWQRKHLPRGTDLPPATRLVLEKGRPVPLAVALAMRGWVNLGITDLHNIAAHLPNSNWQDDWDEVDALENLTRQQLKCSSRDALARVHHRFCGVNLDDDGVTELMNVDEAVKCLSRQDEKEVFNTQKKLKVKVAEQEQVQRRYKDRVAETRSKDEKAAFKAMKKGSRNTGGSSKKPTRWKAIT